MTTKASTELQTELESVQTRLASMRTKFSEAEAATATLTQQAATAFDDKTFGKLQASCTETASLQAIIEELSTQETQLTAAIAQVLDVEARAVAVADLGVLASKANEEYTAYLKEREEFSAVMRHHADTLNDKWEELSATRAQFIQKASGVAPSFHCREPRPEQETAVYQLVSDLRAGDVNLTAIADCKRRSNNSPLSAFV